MLCLPFTSAGSPEPYRIRFHSPLERQLLLAAGTTVATFYVGRRVALNIDLSPYFAYNKDYLSYPLTATSGDALYVFAKSAGGTMDLSSSLTWEEQV